MELELPDQDLAPVEVPGTPTADLMLELSDPAIETADGKRRATATLHFHPHDRGRAIESQRYRVTAPLGPPENEALAWYPERFIDWPTRISLERARRVEERLPERAAVSTKC
ncbi:MAG: hypothetical protein ACLQU1_13910 [Bryobacteraceae bacterium]